MGRTFKTGACALAWFMVAGSVGQVQAAPRCARNNEVTAIQVASIQQQLMVAALTCHDASSFNAFQTGYRTELRRSDADLMRMFKRFYGGARGEREYHAFKTRLANHSSMRSIRDNPSYCAAAQVVFDAALAPRRHTLANFVSGVTVQESSPFDSCEIRVAVGFKGTARSAPDIVPRPKPANLGNTALVNGDRSPIWQKSEGANTVQYPRN